MDWAGPRRVGPPWSAKDAYTWHRGDDEAGLAAAELRSGIHPAFTTTRRGRLQLSRVRGLPSGKGWSSAATIGGAGTGQWVQIQSKASVASSAGSTSKRSRWAGGVELGEMANTVADIGSFAM